MSPYALPYSQWLWNEIAILERGRAVPRSISAGSRPAATAFVVAARKAALIIPGLGPVGGQIGGFDPFGIEALD